jgi:hypothetical protein
MTITGSGNPLSLNDLNVEFGRGGTSQLSLSQSFAGTYAQYGAINRNTGAGQNVTSVFNGGTDFAISWFYDYNDLENNYWDYTFTNNAANSLDIKIDIGATSIYGFQTLTNGTTDSSGGYIDTATSAGTGADLKLALKLNAGTINFVDISVTDPDTSATIYSVTGDDPNNYPNTVLATLYGYQRMQFNMTFYD